MRLVLALLLLAPLVASCTPRIPVKDDFGVSTLSPSGELPPEFVEFNAYDPTVNPLLADQLCATPYEPLEAKGLDATPGSLMQLRGRCRTHVPFFGP